jgi:ribosomal protein S18 acetylase RimI-like enzyme
MEIAKAQIEDLKQILELQKLCYTENATRYNDFNIEPMTQTMDEIEKDFSKCIILKAFNESNIVGSVRAYQKDGTCYIGRLIVHPANQNQGIGKNLMLEIEKSFKETKRFELYTGFRDEKNLYLYNKLGYAQYKKIEIKAGLSLVYLEKIN